MLILKQNTAASVPTPAAGKGTIFLSDSDVLSVKKSSGTVESFPTVGGSNTQVFFNDDQAIGGNANLTFDKATSVLTVTGNVGATRILTDNLLYANGDPYDFQQPAGSNTQVIFNDEGDFGADSTFTFDKTTDTLSATNVVATALTGELQTASQTNITSVGTLTSLSVTGNSDAGNLNATSTVSGTDLSLSGNATVGGNLTVNGNLTYVNVSSFDVEDPIISMGGGPNGAAPTTDDGKDRGSALQYYDGSAITAFMGWDNSGSEFIFGADVSNTDEVISVNTYGNVHGNVFIGDAGGLSNVIAANISGTVANATHSSTANTIVDAAQPNITSVGTLTSVLGGEGSASDFGNATAIFGKDNTGSSLGDNIGVVGEAAANSTAGINGIGVYGYGATNGSDKGTGVYGQGVIGDTNDTGAAVGVRGTTAGVHASGMNVGLYGLASGSSVSNYSLYLVQGSIGTIENPITWEVADNEAGALRWSSAGKANIFMIESTDNSEGISTTGYLNVTGNISATAGIKTDNYYYANGAPVDFQQPAGSNTEVIFNDDGDFGADSTFTFDKDTNVLSATTVTATTLNGALGTASQTAITSVGTLGALAVTGNITSGNVAGTGGVFTYVSGDGANLTSTAGANVTGEVSFAATANAVAGGNVSGAVALATSATSANAVAGANVTGEVDFAATANAVAGANVSGTVALATLATDATSANAVAGANVSGEVDFAATANAVAGGNVSGAVALATSATSANAVAGANVSGEVDFAATANAVAGANVSGTVALASVAGTVSGAAQANITSLGTLTGLGVNGTITASAITANTGVFTGDAGGLSNVVGGNVTGQVANSAVAGTVYTAAQPNITSVGTLSSVTTSGNVDTTANVVTDDIVGKTGGVTITAIGTNQPISLVTTGSGSVDVNSARITELATPTASTDAATKQYVDDVAQGLAVHAPCDVGTTGTLTSITGGTITYDNGTAGVGATLTTSSGNFDTIDGESFSNGERILVKDESNTAHNGIYVKTSSTVLTRASDFDTPTEIAGGDFTFVSTGTTLNDSGFVNTDPVSTVGTDPITFVQFSGAGTYTAGTGLTLTGSEFSITNTAVSAASYGNGTHNATFTVNSRGQLTAAANVEITAGAGSLTGTTINSSVVDSSLTSVGTIDTGVWNGSVIGASYIATLNQNTTGYAATVSTAAQPNITSVGTLSGLTVSGTISGSVSGSAGSVAGQNVSGEVDFAQVANSVAGGNVSGAVAFATTANAVAGANVSGAVSFATTANAVAGANVSGTVASATTAASASSVAGQNVSGEVDFAQVANSVAGANVSGTVASATSATSATTAGSTTSSATFNNSGSGASSGTTFNGGTARTISYNTIGAPSTTGTNASGTWSINVTGSAGSATTATRAATVTTAAQPNITSVGTLSSLNVTGTTNTGTIQSTTLTAGSNSTAGSIIGDWTLTSGSTLNATYADLAEKYTADADYEAGTVVLFAGEAELTVCGNHASHAVAGIITTNPAQVYNAECTAGEGEFVVELALIGRVPCKVIGPVHKGDLIVSSEAPGFGCAADLDNLKVGTIIGKAITGYNGDTPDGVCEVLVGKN